MAEFASQAEGVDSSALADLVNAHYGDLWEQHRNDPAMGLCPICRVSNCEPGRLAYLRLLAAGVLDRAGLALNGRTAVAIEAAAVGNKADDGTDPASDELLG